MLVELGNDTPTADGVQTPAVTTIGVPDSYSYEVAASAKDLASEVAAHVGRSSNGVTRVPDQEALLAVVAAWRAEAAGDPTWVDCDNNDFAVLLGEFFGCPVGRPDDVESTHYTNAGPPGVGPATEEN
jgi:hypothetical protein